MHSIRVQRLQDAARQENGNTERRFDALDWEQYDADANSADTVISEMALVLVIMLGAVLAINMALIALHIG
jgi:hypothetical protein